MSFPPLDTAELRRRLDDPDAQQWTDAQLQHFLSVAAEYWNPRVDQRKFPGAESSYLEGIYQSAVKVAASSTVGLVSADLVGGFDLSATATSGMMRGVLGVIQPCLKSGGVVVA